MGCFSMTCAWSNLGINAGDKVRFLLLNENPYEDEHQTVSPHDEWFPRTFPLTGSYDDYGGVESIEALFGKENWLQGFKLDLVEKGWGDNVAHDVPVSAGFSFDEMLHALHEGRLSILRDTGSKRLFGVPTEIENAPPGVPTVKRIKQLLERKQVLTHSKVGYPPAGTALVGETAYGEIRVRIRRGNESAAKYYAQLESLVPMFSEYAALVTAGSGSYSDEAELLIRPRPGTKGFHGARLPDNQKQLRVSACVIRDDVWQLALKSSGEDLDYFKSQVQKHWNACVERAHESKAGAEGSHFQRLWVMGAGSDLDEVSGLIRGPVPFAVSLPEHWGAAISSHMKTAIPAAELQEWLDGVAELLVLQKNAYAFRYCWRPSTVCGSQVEDFEVPAKFHAGLAKLAKSLAAEMRLDD